MSKHNISIREIIKDRMKETEFTDRLSFVIASAEALPFRYNSFEGLILISHISQMIL